MFDADAVKAIADLKSATTFDVREPDTERESTFSDRQLFEVKATPPALPTILKVSTLKGFCEAIEQRANGFEPKDVVVQIVDFKTVKLVKRTSDVYGRLTVLIEATPVPFDWFDFGKWLNHEEFVIQTQSRFVSTEDLAYITQVASSVTAAATSVSEDDGVSQRLTLKAGLKLGEVATLKNRVRLAPYRTFPEVNQVVSEFLFRAKGGGENSAPQLALFEADGGAWRLAAVQELERFLSVQLHVKPRAKGALAEAEEAPVEIPIIA